MPVEIIGEVGTPGADPEWIFAEAILFRAKSYEFRAFNLPQRFVKR